MLKVIYIQWSYGIRLAFQYHECAIGRDGVTAKSTEYNGTYHEQNHRDQDRNIRENPNHADSDRGEYD